MIGQYQRAIPAASSIGFEASRDLGGRWGGRGMSWGAKDWSLRADDAAECSTLGFKDCSLWLWGGVTTGLGHNRQQSDTIERHN